MSVLYLPPEPTPRQRSAMALRGRGYSWARIAREMGMRFDASARQAVLAGRKCLAIRARWVTRGSKP